MIKIGIIDSGIDQEHLNRTYIEGMQVRKNQHTNRIEFCDDFFDQIGHGSDCYKIISSRVPDANYFIVKIFEDKLVADLDTLAKAIDLCLTHNTDIINISAGVKSDKIPDILRVVCDEAYEQDIVIIAAQHNNGYRCFPAGYDKVIAVGSTDLSEGEIYRFTSGNDGVRFYTSARTAILHKQDWLRGTSFSCARMTAYVATLIQEKGKMEIHHLIQTLINNGTKTNWQ